MQQRNSLAAATSDYPLLLFAPLGARCLQKARPLKRFFLAPAERNIAWSPRTIDGNIALRGSASYRVGRTIYKHFAPLERKLIPVSHLNVECTSQIRL